MSWGTSFNTEVIISHKIFKNIYQLREYIDELKGDVRAVEDKILLMVGGDARKLVSTEDSTYLLDGVIDVRNAMKSLFDELEEAHCNLMKAMWLLDEVEYNNLNLKDLYDESQDSSDNTNKENNDEF